MSSTCQRQTLTDILSWACLPPPEVRGSVEAEVPRETRARPGAALAGPHQCALEVGGAQVWGWAPQNLEFGTPASLSSLHSRSVSAHLPPRADTAEPCVLSCEKGSFHCRYPPRWEFSKPCRANITPSPQEPASQCAWILLDWVEGLITQAGKGTQEGTRISCIAVGEGHVSSSSWLSCIS